MRMTRQKTMKSLKHLAWLLVFVSSSSSAQLWGGALEGLGRWGEQMQRDNAREDLERARAKHEMERDRLQYEHQLEMNRIARERQARLLEEQRQAEIARAQKQAEENARARREHQERLAEKERLEREIEILKVERAHPGWEKTIATPQFESWKQAQPTNIQRLAASQHADDAILMLDLYKKDTGAAQSKKDSAVNARRQRSLPPQKEKRP